MRGVLSRITVLGWTPPIKKNIVTPLNDSLGLLSIEPDSNLIKSNHGFGPISSQEMEEAFYGGLFLVRKSLVAGRYWEYLWWKLNKELLIEV